MLFQGSDDAVFSVCLLGEEKKKKKQKGGQHKNVILKINMLVSSGCSLPLKGGRWRFTHSPCPWSLSTSLVPGLQELLSLWERSHLCSVCEALCAPGGHKLVRTASVK